MMTANKNNNLDATDWKILAELQRDARSSYKEIGEAVGMTRPAVRERMLRMEESGVVTGYRAEIDTDALGRALHVMISFKFNSDQKYDKNPTTSSSPFCAPPPASSTSGRSTASLTSSSRRPSPQKNACTAFWTTCAATASSGRI